MEELLWDLFKTTGKIEYYLRYKEIKEKKRGEKAGDWTEI